MSNITLNKVSRKDLLLLNPSQLNIKENFNIRQDYGNIEELALSILENGLKRPLTGYKQGEFYIITDGHRRFKAINHLLQSGYTDIGLIPFIPENKGYSEHDRIFDMFTLNDGKNLTPLEQGELFKRLINLNYSIKDISKRIGKTYQYIDSMLNVASCDNEIKQEIVNNNISASLIAEIKNTIEKENVNNPNINIDNEIKAVIELGKEQLKLKPNKKDKITKSVIKPLLEKAVSKTADKTSKIHNISKNDIEYMKPLHDILTAFLKENKDNMYKNVYEILYSISEYSNIEITEDELLAKLSKHLISK